MLLMSFLMFCFHSAEEKEKSEDKQHPKFHQMARYAEAQSYVKVGAADFSVGSFGSTVTIWRLSALSEKKSVIENELQTFLGG
jgi:hypothetical protein